MKGFDHPPSSERKIPEVGVSHLGSMAAIVCGWPAMWWTWVTFSLGGISLSGEEMRETVAM